MSPFELVYGIDAKLPIPLELSTLHLQCVLEDNQFKDSLEKRVLYLTKVEEQIEKVVERIKEH